MSTVVCVQMWKAASMFRIHRVGVYYNSSAKNGGYIHNGASMSLGTLTAVIQLGNPRGVDLVAGLLLLTGGKVAGRDYRRDSGSNSHFKTP